MDIWLLEYGTIPLDETGELIYPELLPTLAEVWSQASDLRQIHWLWQMAKLWYPLQKKAMVSSLLNPFLTRVNNQLLQLLELSKDEVTAPNLRDLGAFWAGLIPTAAANIQDFLASLTQELESGDLDRPESLIAILDYALQHYGRGPCLMVKIPWRLSVMASVVRKGAKSLLNWRSKPCLGKLIRVPPLIFKSIPIVTVLSSNRRFVSPMI